MIEKTRSTSNYLADLIRAGYIGIQRYEPLDIEIDGQKVILKSIKANDIIDGVFFNDKITHIDDCCFGNQSPLNLIEIILPNVVEIGYQCFDRLHNLKIVKMPNVESMRDSCFTMCTRLVKVEFPKIKVIGEACFRCCYKLEEFICPPPNIFKKGESCFASCPSLSTESWKLLGFEFKGSETWKQDKEKIMNKTEIFTKEQKNKSDYILKSPFSKLSDLNSKEIKDLAVIWCYYSGKIEGNTYTYVETEALLKDGVTSEKKYEDAEMLKNLYKTFNNEIEYIHNKGNKENIDITALFRVHKSISNNLVSTEESGHLRTRAVRISGTEYVPPRDVTDIKIKLNEIFYNQQFYDNDLERAVYVHCNLARLQPFIDDNKRTARMMESIILMNADIVPIYSTKDSDMLNYRKSLMEFYETENYSAYSDYLLDKQIERIKLISNVIYKK